MNGAQTAVLATELRIEARHGVLAGTAAVTVAWLAVLLALPATVRPTAVAWILFLDVAAMGLFFVPALAVVERANGVPAALALTRVGATTVLATRVAVLAIMAMVAAVPLLVAAGTARRAPVDLLVVLVTVATVSVLVSLLSVVVLGRATTLTTWMTRLPGVAIPLLAPALAHWIGLWDTPLSWLSPFTGALGMLAGQWSWAAAAWLAAWVLALGTMAARIGYVTESPAAPPRPASATRTAKASSAAGAPAAGAPAAGASTAGSSDDRSRSWGRWAAVRSMARVDRRTLLGDGLLVALVAGVPVLALAVRWVAGPGATWLMEVHGLDVVPVLPVVWAFVLVVHTPTMIGAVTGLVFTEDRDSGVLPAVATTRASLSTLVGYRLAVTATAAAALVAIAVPLAGAHHPRGVFGVAATSVVAGAVATVPALVLAAHAHDRAQAMAMTKAMSLPLYLPLAWWFVDGPAGWAFAVVPTAWAVRVAWATSVAEVVVFGLAGILACGLLDIVLVRRLRTTLVG